MTEREASTRDPRWLTPTSAAVALVVSAALAFWALQANMRAVFGPIDDHEPLRWMGSDGALSPSEYLPTLFGHTEIATFGDASRYRPAYYAVRVLQAVVFGAHPTAWYVSVVAMYVLACAVLGFVVARWVTIATASTRRDSALRASIVIAAAALATTAFASLPAWRGIAARLGPSELLAALALALLLLGATMILEGQSSWWWALLLASTWMVVGAKESMLPLALVPAIVAVDRIRAGGRRPWLAMAAVAGLIPALIVLAAVLPPVLAGGSAGYGSTGDGSRTALALSALLSTYRWYWLPAVAVLVVSFIVFAWSRVSGRRLVGTIVALIALSMIWFAYDMWVYSGTYPLPRYEMNTQIIKTLWVFAAVGLCLAALAGHRSRDSRWVAWLPLLGALGLTASTLAGAAANLTGLRAEADSNARATLKYHSQMDVILASLRESPVALVVIVPNNDSDEEPVHAISQEIRLKTSNAPGIVVSADSALVSGDASASGNAGVCIFINHDPVSDPPCAVARNFRVDARGM